MNKMPVLSSLDEKTVFGVSSQGVNEEVEDKAIAPTGDDTSSPKGDSSNLGGDKQFDI